MNEAETRAELIDPALAAAGWGVAEGSLVRREYPITAGRILGGGRRERAKSADYLLLHRGRPLAVVEAKAATRPAADGVAQAKDYAARLNLRHAFATNGRDLWRIDMDTGAEGPADGFPSPDELFADTHPEPDRWRDAFAAAPWPDKSGTKPPRYYQRNAVEAVLRRVADGEDRVLLTLATGTGKTAIAFWLAVKLIEARWSLANWRDVDGPSRTPRILFLADRTGLADQAFNAFNEFGWFEERALSRITPAEIRRRGGMPRNAQVFFTIFQTGMTQGEGEDAPRFAEYPPDFFDLVIVDECHRGGANDESSWRGILDHFAPALQVGLTATPKRRDNIDTYRYFGDPAYVYSLKDGINDGFLTPFKVRQFATTLDDYVWTPDDRVIEGEPVEGKRYREREFNRAIHIREREAKRVELMLAEIGPTAKTLVFCASQDHAALVRDLINERNPTRDPRWCVRVTANAGALGDEALKAFQDNEKTIPNVLTTSQKLSTGVDARNVRAIALLRPVNSMIEFKQIIGRGTRVYEGKDHFTVLDFVRAYEHFEDPEWDGEPIEPEERPPVTEADEPDAENGEVTESREREARARVVIQLADGKARVIQHMSATTFWSPTGKPMSAAQFIEELFGTLPDLFRDEAELRALWGDPAARTKLLDGLEERGFSRSALADLRRAVATEDSDLFDVLAWVAFANPIRTRAERVAARRSAVLDGHDEKLAAFLDYVLGQYVAHDVAELDPARLAHLLQLSHGDVLTGAKALGGVPIVNAAFLKAQERLFL